jgi:AcrR family transcriptional regulator
MWNMASVYGELRGMDAALTRKPRSDARHNRSHVLSVARATFAAQGLEVTMRELARRSGLGVATLYRHFPTREDLVSAAFAEQVAGCLEIVRNAAADPDAWRGIVTVVEEICIRQTQDRGFNAALLGSTTMGKIFAPERAENARALAGLIGRARREGAVRTDLTIEDFQLVLIAIASRRAVALDTAQAHIEARRLAALLLQGIRAQPNAALEPLPTTAA